MSDHFLGIGGIDTIFKHLESKVGKASERVEMGIDALPCLTLLKIENKNVKSSRCRDFGIKLTKRARRRVSGICKQWLSLRLSLCVHALKIRSGNVDLAAHSKCQRFGKLHGDGKYGFEICGHVLAFNAVAAGGTLNENAVLIAQGNRQPVDLRLNRKHGVRKNLGHFIEKIPKLIIRENVCKRVHFH